MSDDSFATPLAGVDPSRTTDSLWSDEGSNAPFPVDCGAASDTGAVREHNEDAYLLGQGIFIVADGMGGHSRGDAASGLVVQSFGEFDDRPWTATLLGQAFDRSAQRVRQLASYGPPPGTTVVGVALSGDQTQPQWLIFNIGDSRAYLWRSEVLEQISVDHSRAQEIRDSGIPMAAEIAARLDRNVITRAIGGGSDADPVPDQWLLEVLPGDQVLLCSDGLSTELSDADIASVLRLGLAPQDSAQTLCDAAVAAGGHDNVTVVIVSARGQGQPPILSSNTAPTIPDLRSLPDAPAMSSTTLILESDSASENAADGEPDEVGHKPRRAQSDGENATDFDHAGSYESITSVGSRYVEEISHDRRAWNEWDLDNP